jgi:hypothetical protein
MNDTFASPEFPQPNVYGPITAGQLYERTFTLLRENFKLFAGIVLVAIGVEIVVGAALGVGGLLTRHTTEASSVAKMLFLVPIAIFGGVLIYVFVQIVQGALFFATRSRLTGPPLGVGNACRMAADQIGRIIGISVLVAVRMFGWVLLLYLVFGLLFGMIVVLFGGVAHLAGQFRSPVAPSVGAYAGIAAVALAAFVIYLLCVLWLTARYALSVPACLDENLGVTDSIRRSVRLSANDKGRLFSLLVGVACMWIAITAVTVPVEFMSASMRTHSSVPVAFGFVWLLLAGVRLLFSGLVIAILGIGTTLCYYDLRVRKEGLGALPPSIRSVAVPLIVPDDSPLPNPDISL